MFVLAANHLINVWSMMWLEVRNEAGQNLHNCKIVCYGYIQVPLNFYNLIHVNNKWFVLV